MTDATEYDRRALTDDQRHLAEDIASSMDYGHEEACGVWGEGGDGCTCPLLVGVADGLQGARVVVVEVERGYDPTTRRGDRVQRMPFRPMPAASASVTEPRPIDTDDLRRLRDALGAFEAWAEAVIPMLRNAGDAEAADFGEDRIAQSQDARTERMYFEVDR